MTAVQPQHPTVVVAVDGSDEADHACRIAIDLARTWHAPLHAVHAWRPYLPAALYGGAGVGVAVTQDTVTVLHDAAVGVMLRVQRTAAAHGMTAVEHVVEADDTADAILEVADAVDATLVVAGRRGLGLMGRALLGSVSEVLLHRSTRPLLLVHGDPADWPPRTVVAATDGSLEARRASRLGAQVAAAVDAPMVLLHAVPRDADILAVASLSGLDRAVGDVRESLRRRAAALQHLTSAEIDVRVELASPALGILGAASSARHPVLIALGTHGRGMAQRLVMGSVAARVLHDPDVTTLLVVPPAVRHH